jgi:hypothetical protein
VSESGTREAVPCLAVSATARLWGFHINTLLRAMEDGTLPYVTFRSARKIATPLAEYVAAAIRSGRTGSVEQWAAEYVAAHQPEGIAS